MKFSNAEVRSTTRRATKMPIAAAFGTCWQRRSRQTVYTPRYFLNMINENGALATAHALLAGQPSEGFTKLWSLGALHLSVEALVGRQPLASGELFSEDELRRARRRLRDAGYVVPAID